MGKIVANPSSGSSNYSGASASTRGELKSPPINKKAAAALVKEVSANIVEERQQGPQQQELATLEPQNHPANIAWLASSQNIRLAHDGDFPEAALVS